MRAPNVAKFQRWLEPIMGKPSPAGSGSVLYHKVWGMRDSLFVAIRQVHTFAIACGFTEDAGNTHDYRKYNLGRLAMETDEYGGLFSLTITINTP